MSKKRPTVSIVLPVLNEIDGMKWFMPKLKKEWYDELIIVDGGSTDGTVEFCKENNYPIFPQPGNGLHLAYVEAIKHLNCDIVITATPDGNSLPEKIPELVAKINEGNDMVIVSRYLPPAKSADDDFFTAIGNWGFTRIINLLFGGNYTDSLVGFRGYRREALLSMKMYNHEEEHWTRKVFSTRMNSWETGSSIRAAKMKLKTADIPGDEPERIGGYRKMSIIKNGLGTVVQIVYELIIGLNFSDDK
jgi:glycosyltransferase involved in cell wall biosynthesis